MTSSVDLEAGSKTMVRVLAVLLAVVLAAVLLLVVAAPAARG